MNDQRIRNTGIVPVAVAEAIAGKTLAIAGSGGVGGNVADFFVRQCGIGRLKLADPEAYDLANTNCQVGAFTDTIGVSKVKVITAMIERRDPNLTVDQYGAITLENIDEFLEGVDVLLDAVDFRSPEIHLALTARAAELKIPVVLGVEIAYGARAVWFDPRGMTFREFFHLHSGSDALELRHMIMRLPVYSDLKALKAIQSQSIPAPSIAVGGASVAALVVTLLEALLSGVDVPPPAPIGTWIDSKEGAGGRIRFRRLVWWSSVGRALARNLLHRNAPSI